MFATVTIGHVDLSAALSFVDCPEREVCEALVMQK